MTREEVDERILSSAIELLRGRGLGAVSIESVSAHSGVAKTTIYRRFDNRDELLSAAVVAASRPAGMPDDLDTQDTLRWALSHARETIEHVVGRGTLAAVLADTDPEVSPALLGMIRATVSPLRDHLRAAVSAGRVRADLDIELLLSVLAGSVIAEMIRGRPTGPEWADSVLALVWPGMAPGQ